VRSDPGANPHHTWTPQERIFNHALEQVQEHDAGQGDNVDEEFPGAQAGFDVGDFDELCADDQQQPRQHGQRNQLDEAGGRRSGRQIPSEGARRLVVDIKAAVAGGLRRPVPLLQR
jgi:hypothetical protein